LFTVLVAEDNLDDYLLLEHAFERAEFAANRQHVRDGEEAKAYLRGDGEFGDRNLYPLPQLIVADLKMPRMNGLELLHWARQQPIIKLIPFVFLSASGDVDDVRAAYEGFANAYHIKPSRLEDLIILVGEVRTYWFRLSVRPELPRAAA